MTLTLRYGGIMLALALGLQAAPATVEKVKPASERRIRLTSGWQFLKGDAEGAQNAAFDDSAWRTLDLPHDWAIEGPFDRKINPHAGALPYFGTGWYRKHFTLDGVKPGQKVSIEFDGAMANSTVWLNGVELGGRPYGYIGFSFDLTPQLRAGENVLAVRLTPEDQSSRWYPGAGIYRNVWLDFTGPVHVARWGTYITTPSVTDAQATAAARTTLRNESGAAAEVTLQSIVYDPSGKAVARNGRAVSIPAGGEKVVDEELRINQPVRWDIGAGRLYRLASEILVGKRVVDRYETAFGIRTLAFSHDDGLSVNGKHVKLQGVCMHHDLGALGSAVNRRATERQLQIMQSMGVNAIRTSHNPPSPELLDLCDRMGLLVMDEAFDMWRQPKVKNGHGKYFDQWAERDLRDMLRRDRNHPSIILWSIGNEILEQGKADGWKVAKMLSDICHEEDRSRPTTAGFNNLVGAIKNGLADQVDVAGFNYKPLEYAKVLSEHPKWVVFGSETASCVSSRGVYHLPVEKYQKHDSLQLSSYDIIAPPWAYCPDVEFEVQKKLPNLLGEFVWTGFDYLGEPTPYFQGRGSNDKDWPSRSSYFGIVDLAGFPKDRYFLYKSVWTAAPMVHILPHWNWEGREGQAIPVFAYSNGEEVELFLNGKSLGRKKVGAEPVQLPVGKNVSETLKYSSSYRLAWQVPYAAGTLRAVAYRKGVEVAHEEVKTAGAPAKLEVVADRSAIAADGDDLAFLTVKVVDAAGNFCPMADTLVKFQVEGAGMIAAVDNGNAATEESFQAHERKAFNGLALVIVRGRKGAAGEIKLTATAAGLAPASVRIKAGK